MSAFRWFQARGYPRRWIHNLVSFGIFDQAEDSHGVVAGGLQAFPNERSTGVRPLAGHPSKFWKALVKQPLPMVRRFGARSVSFGTTFLYLPFLSLPFRRDHSGNFLGIAIDWGGTLPRLRFINALMLPTRNLNVLTAIHFVGQDQTVRGQLPDHSKNGL